MLFVCFCNWLWLWLVKHWIYTVLLYSCSDCLIGCDGLSGRTWHISSSGKLLSRIGRSNACIRFLTEEMSAIGRLKTSIRLPHLNNNSNRSVLVRFSIKGSKSKTRHVISLHPGLTSDALLWKSGVRLTQPYSKRLLACIYQLIITYHLFSSTWPPVSLFIEAIEYFITHKAFQGMSVPPLKRVYPPSFVFIT